MARYGLAFRRAALAAAATLTVAVPAADAATVDNPGPITAQFKGGSLLVENLFDLQFTPTTPVGISGSIGPDGALTVPPSGFTFPPYNGTLPIPAPNTPVSVQVVADSVSGNVNPLTGVGAVNVKGHVDFTLGGATTCSLGTSSNPINLNLKTTTAGGSAYNPSTGALTLVDDSWVLPSLSNCVGPLATNPTILALMAIPTLSDAGKNKLTLSGVITPAPTGSVSTGGGDGGGGGGGGGGGSTPPPTTPGQGGNGGGGGGTNPPAKQCVVPKLKGMTLAKAKAALKQANCKLGKVTKKASSKKKNTVIGFSPKAGSKQADGAKVALTLSKGPAKKKRR